MKLTVIGSGSEGNSIILTGLNRRIVIDCGFSHREFARRCESAGIDADGFDMIFLTHEHSDHIRGAGVLARRYQCPVVATEQTLRRGRAILGTLPAVRVLFPGDLVEVGDLSIQAFQVPHDAADPVGYTVSSNEIKIGICTDLGCITRTVREMLTGCHGLVLEMNHDVNMLMAGPYPWELKQRIRSDKGHLSNDDAGAFLHEIRSPDLKHLILAHLSKENNLPDLAHVIASQAVESEGPLFGTRVSVASQDEVMETLDFGFDRRFA